MNKEKLLVRIRDIPKNIPVSELGNALIRLMSFNKMNSKEMAGLIVENTEHEDVINLYVLFVKRKTIDEFKAKCHEICNYYYLLLFNAQLLVEFVGREKAILKTSKYDDGTESRVVMIKHKKHQDIVDILECLPSYHFYEEENNKIVSIIQNGTAVFIKFKSHESTTRAIQNYEKHGYEVKLSETYTYVERMKNRIRTKQYLKRRRGYQSGVFIQEYRNNSKMKFLPRNINKSDRIVRIENNPFKRY